MPEFTIVSSSIGALAFAILLVLLIFSHRGTPIGRRMIVASAVSSAWLFSLAVQHGHSAWYAAEVAHYLEIAHALVWIFVLTTLLNQFGSRGYFSRVRLVLAAALVSGAALVFFRLGFAWWYRWVDDPALVTKLNLLCYLSLSLCGLVLTEQLYRNTEAEARWSIKHFCIALAGAFAFEFLLYSDAVLFNQINPDMIAARGIAHAIVVPLIAITATRNVAWQLRLFVSRTVVFHSASVLVAGIYLLLMAGAGYYLKAYGGTWGGALRVAFLFGTVTTLVALGSSRGLRSRISAFLAKHFYRNKYDYGSVWLSFTDELAHAGPNLGDLQNTILRAVANIMDSTGGTMWQQQATGAYEIVSRYGSESTSLPVSIAETSALVRRLRSDETVLDLAPASRLGGMQHDGNIPSEIIQHKRAWIVIPIQFDAELLAFILLEEPRSGAPFTAEDRALLRTLGRQAAGYLALLHATEELAEAHQFDAFNRLSAFLVHDLKNVVAQLSLVTKNAERHRGKPEFVDDAFSTINDAVRKMTRMLGTLRQPQTVERDAAPFELDAVVAEVIARVGERTPAPHFQSATAGVYVRGLADRFAAVIEHLVQNAQDATANDGTIEIRSAIESDKALLEIADSGCGMERSFIRDRLFKPFETTKGKAGMGIGVYESLHTINAMGGHLRVTSEVGVGTVFTIELPLAVVAEPKHVTEVY